MSRRRNKNRKRRYSGGTDTSADYQTVGAGAGWVKKDYNDVTSTPTTSKYSYTSCDHVEVPIRIVPGMTILATAYHDMTWAHEQDRQQPDVGLYLDSAWGRGEVMSTSSVEGLPFGNSSGQKIIFPWPDASKPASMRSFAAMVEWLSEQLALGKVVETGCLGAHGRTGTLLAALIILNRDEGAKEAIAWVRREHCAKAIETFTQEEFLYRYWNLLHGMPLDANLPERPKYTSSYGGSYTSKNYSDKWGSTAGTSGASGYDNRIPGSYQYFDSKEGVWKTREVSTYRKPTPPLDSYNDNADMSGGYTGSKVYKDDAPDPIDESERLDEWLMRAEERAAQRMADEAADVEVYTALEQYDAEGFDIDSGLCPVCDEATCAHPDLCADYTDEEEARWLAENE